MILPLPFDLFTFRLFIHCSVAFFDIVLVKGCGMGPLLVLVSPCSCHMQNWVCFCVVYRYLTSEKRNCFLFWKSNFKMALIWKKGLFLAYFSDFFSNQGKVARLPSARISLTYFAHPIAFFFFFFFFFALPIVKKIRIYQYGFSLVWFLV